MSLGEESSRFFGRVLEQDFSVQQERQSLSAEKRGSGCTTAHDPAEVLPDGGGPVLGDRHFSYSPPPSSSTIDSVHGTVGQGGVPPLGYGYNPPCEQMHPRRVKVSLSIYDLTATGGCLSYLGNLLLRRLFQGGVFHVGLVFRALDGESLDLPREWFSSWWFASRGRGADLLHEAVFPAAKQESVSTPSSGVTSASISGTISVSETASVYSRENSTAVSAEHGGGGLPVAPDAASVEIGFGSDGIQAILPGSYFGEVGKGLIQSHDMGEILVAGKNMWLGEPVLSSTAHRAGCVSLEDPVAHADGVSTSAGTRGSTAGGSSGDSFPRTLSGGSKASSSSSSDSAGKDIDQFAEDRVPPGTIRSSVRSNFIGSVRSGLQTSPVPSPVMSPVPSLRLEELELRGNSTEQVFREATARSETCCSQNSGRPLLHRSRSPSEEAVGWSSLMLTLRDRLVRIAQEGGYMGAASDVGVRGGGQGGAAQQTMQTMSSGTGAGRDGPPIVAAQPVLDSSSRSRRTAAGVPAGPRATPAAPPRRAAIAMDVVDNRPLNLIDGDEDNHNSNNDPSYDMLDRNCIHFAEDVCFGLGLGELPGWVGRVGRCFNCCAPETLKNCVREDTEFLGSNSLCSPGSVSDTSRRGSVGFSETLPRPWDQGGGPPCSSSWSRASSTSLGGRGGPGPAAPQEPVVGYPTAGCGEEGAPIYGPFVGAFPQLGGDLTYI